MASNADGSVTLDFSINTDDLSKEIDNANKSVEKFTQNTQKNMEKSDRAIEEAKEYLEALAKEAKTVNQEYNFVVNIDGIEDAEKDLEYFRREGEETSKEIKDVEKALENLTRDFGDYSEQAILTGNALEDLKYKLSINTKNQQELKKAIDKAKKAKQEAAKITAEYGTSAKDAGDKTEKLGESTKKTGKSIDSFQVAMGNLISKGIEKTISAIGDLLDKTKDLRKQMAMLEANAQNAGIGAAATEEAMVRLGIVTEDTDSRLEALSNLMLAGVDENQLAEAVDVLSGAVVAVPGTMQIENIAESLQETVATGEAVGQFAELLHRYGVNVEDFTKRLQRTGDESDRLEMILEELNDTGLAEYFQNFVKNNPDLEEASRAQEAYNQALVSLSEILQPLQTEVMKEFTKNLSENKDKIKALADVVLFLLDGILQIFSVFSSMPPEMHMFLIILVGVITIASKMDSAFGDAGDTVKGVSGAIKTFTKALDGSYNTVFQWIVLIGVAVAVLSFMLYLILAIKDGTEKAGEAMNNFKMPELPNMDKLNPNSISQKIAYSNIRGHAKGTESARRGWSWVGEKGPELVYLNGGEKILTASQSMAMGMVASRGAGQSYNQTINISVNGIRQMDEVVKWYTTRRQMERAR